MKKKEQKSFSKIYNIGDETSCDGLIWFWDTLDKFTKAGHEERYACKRFKITIQEVITKIK